MDLALVLLVVIVLAVILLMGEANRGRVGRNPRPNYPPPRIPAPDGGTVPVGRLEWRWRVKIEAMGDSVSVRPVLEPTGDEFGMGVIQDSLVSYCRTDAQVERAKVKWQAWCDRENTRRARAREIAARHA